MITFGTHLRHCKLFRGLAGRRRGALILAVLLTSACQQTQETRVAPTTDPINVNTAAGTYRGEIADAAANVRRFVGIRYAAPPVEQLRWQPPQPLAKGASVQTQDGFGAACYQPYSYDEFVWRRGEFPRSEDCLFLNLWTPAATTGAKLPVMVWFHGGGHTGGYGHAKIFDGVALAKRDVIVVTMNYRLGVFGFLAHPELAQESPVGAAGNYGLMDKIASLEWVRDNIEAFGGDPTNVTIFGQSAGSMSVCALLAAKPAQGLFHKVIGQSAAGFASPLAINNDPAGQADGARMAAGLSLAELRELDAPSIEQRAVDAKWGANGKIVIDGHVLQEPIADTFARDAQAAVPTIVGSLANEGHLLFPLNTELTKDKLGERLQRQFGADAAKLMTLYATELEQSPGLAQREIFTDMFMAWGMRRWAQFNQRRGENTYLYFMSHAAPAWALYTPDNPSLNLPDGPRSAGAYHSADLALVFGNTQLVGEHWQAFDHTLGNHMADYWTNFARTGNPNGEGLADWPRFDQDNTTLVFKEPIGATQGIRQAKLDLFDAVFSIEQVE